MDKEKVREHVNTMLNEFNGDHLEDLLMIIKEWIENEIEDEQYRIKKRI